LNKAPDAFRTISEVAEELDVPQHVLRFWESRFQQIRPMKRGGGRRYYRPDDVDLLRGIRHLLYGEGYTIRGVQRILRDQSVKFVQSVWQAGAEQPRRGPDDDEDAGEDVAASGAEPASGVSPAVPEAPGEAPPERRVRSLGQAGADTALARALAPRPGHADLRKLAAVLDDLTECRRLIDAALADGQ
jgi:DNA-binding transcriptional MerR regulator